MRRSFFSMMMVIGAVATGCSDDPAPTDSGVTDLGDAPADTAPDVAPDGQGDGAADVASDAAADVGLDTAVDGAADAASDTAVDAAGDTAADAAGDTAADAASDGGAAASCVASGGTVGTTLCCASASDFPNTCAVGACGCAPGSSRMVMTCTCPTGQCFNGATCAPR